jgi:outer membrane protein assembly factor BamE
MRRTLTIIAATAAAAAMCGCVYRPSIQQGNLLQLDEIDQVKVGMTRSQVRYVLGTPMVSDPFQPDRWDYVYYLQQGRNKHVDHAHFVVLFEGDKVKEVNKLALPEETDTARRVRQERDKRAAAEAKAKAEQSSAAPAAGTPTPPAAPAVPATPQSAPAGGAPATSGATAPPAPAPTQSPATQPPPPGGG